MTAVPLGPGREFDHIRAIAHRLGAAAPVLGNDCAYVEAGAALLALSTDLSVEGVHFRREWLTLEEIGWRAAAGSLSDLAAAGAEPIGLLAAVAAPVPLAAEDLTQMMAGVGAAVVSAGGQVLGGDLSRGDLLTIAITVIGRAPRRIGRGGARPGDGIWVTGELGGARAALAAWLCGRSPGAQARERFAHPVARVAEGQWLARHGVRAMMDVSDGLGGDAGHLAAASGVAIRISLDRLPVAGPVAAAAHAANEPPAVFAARGGEDYELLVAMPPEFEPAGGFPLTRIGVAQAGSGVSFDLGGSDLALSGYDHFA